MFVLGTLTAIIQGDYMGAVAVAVLLGLFTICATLIFRLKLGFIMEMSVAKDYVEFVLANGKNLRLSKYIITDIYISKIHIVFKLKDGQKLFYRRMITLKDPEWVEYINHINFPNANIINKLDIYAGFIGLNV